MNTPPEDTTLPKPFHNEDLESQLNLEAQLTLELQLKRALADYDNLNKRFQKEKEDVIKYSNEVLMMNLISVVDGLSMTLERFTTLLAEAGFSETKVQVGDTFDPRMMEAADSDGKGNTVTEVYNSSYTLHGKLIRPARVKVGSI